MDRNSSISVIIPVYNRAHCLTSAIESVLKQTAPPMEIIVVDDGSTDNTAQVVGCIAEAACIPIRYVYKTNHGPAAARNIGLSLAQGEYIAFQDSDDCWAVKKSEIQLSLIQNYPHAAAVIGYSQMICDLNIQKYSPGVIGRPGLILLLQAGLFHRTLFYQAGRFDEALRVGEDLSWFIRVLELPVEIVIHPDIVMAYHRHDSNLSESLQHSQQQLMKILRHTLLRRRQLRNIPERIATITYTTGEQKN